MHYFEKFLCALSIRKCQGSVKCFSFHSKIDEQCDAFVPHVSDSGVFNVILPGSGLQKLDDLMEELAKHHSKVFSLREVFSFW